MYTKEQASRLRQEFWTTFGKYISPCPSAEGLEINWVNYKTGIKNLYFRMDASSKAATISIEITHPDPDWQQLMYEKFESLRYVLRESLQEDWNWELFNTDEDGKVISRIYTSISSVNVFNKDDWHLLISFFKPRIIALDEFWSNAKYSFEEFI